MGTFSKAELTEAFAQFQATVDRAATSGDWNLFADLFTEDVEYVEHSYGTFRGREAVRTWALKTMTGFPGSHMTAFPANWFVVDEDRDRIVCEIDNPMRDPGDGSVHTAANLTILTYAGDGLWSREEDVYNPMEFSAMAMGWCKRAEELGTITDAARAWQAKMSAMLRTA